MDNQQLKTMPSSRRRVDVRKLAMLAMLSAVAYVVLYLSKLIPINIAGFLNCDLKDVVIGVSGFMYGPLAAAGISVVVSLIEMVTISGTGPIGLLMNVLSTCAFICTASFIYKKQHTIKGAVLGLIAGALLMTAVMLLWNYLITPIYMGYPRQAVADMLLPIFLPYNLVKAGVNATLIILIYKPVVRALRKGNMLPPSTGAAVKTGSRLTTGVLIVAAVVLVTCILLTLVLAGII